jgi:hypothetical protein
MTTEEVLDLLDQFAFKYVDDTFQLYYLRLSDAKIPFEAFHDLRARQGEGLTIEDINKCIELKPQVRKVPSEIIAKLKH